MDVWLWFFLFLIYFFYLFGWLRSFYECLADFLHRLHFNIKYLGIWNCLVYCVFRLRTATIHDVVRTLHDMNGVSKNWISDDFVSNLIIFFFSCHNIWYSECWRARNIARGPMLVIFSIQRYFCVRFSFVFFSHVRSNFVEAKAKMMRKTTMSTTMNEINNADNYYWSIKKKKTKWWTSIWISRRLVGRSRWQTTIIHRSHLAGANLVRKKHVNKTTSTCQ